MTIFLSSFYRNKLVWVLGLLFIGLLIALYIVQVNTLITLAYRIAEAERSIVRLELTNTALQEHTRRAASFQELEELARLYNFERVNSITYLRILSGGVAQSQ